MQDMDLTGNHYVVWGRLLLEDEATYTDQMRTAEQDVRVKSRPELESYKLTLVSEKRSKYEKL